MVKREEEEEEEEESVWLMAWSHTQTRKTRKRQKRHI